MSTSNSATDQAPPCPDPSAHARDTTLQDQASKAALYVTHDHKGETEERQVQALGPDGKLSSAGAAASLKHAKPKDLPSFPSVGIEQDKSGNTAANLANQNHKAFEYWKPELSSNASKAALLANEKGGKLNLWQPSASETGNSAATIAMNKQKGLSPQLDYGYTDDGHKKALLAATLSTSTKPKPKREASPQPSRYPDAENASANALNAASVAHKPSNRASTDSGRVSSPANEAARLTHLNPASVNPKMFTEHPPIGPDHGNAALRGATASMSKNTADQAKKAQEAPATTLDAKAQAANYINLQETAQKLAAERLAKLNPDSAQVYREHYGYGEEPKHKLSIRNRKGRPSTDDQGEDQAGAKRIQNQMGKFNDELAGLDSKKRTQDRTSLMAAAEKAVKARMSGIDQDIFEQTGKVTPQMMEQWEAKARAKANADSEKRMENHGLVHIGGGKYMDQAEIDAIAQGRMQPTLDEITENAELRRAREEEVRLDQEQRKNQAIKEKEREKDTAAELKRQKSYEKMTAQFEKDIQKRHQREIKDAEKAQKRQQKEEAKDAKRLRKQQDSQWKREQQGAGVAERRSASISSSSSSEADTRGVTSTDTAPVTEPAGRTSPEPPTIAPLAEPTTTIPVARDPPGVPTDFGHKAEHNEDGQFQTDSGPSARQNENKIKRGEEEGTMGPKQKRESRVKSLLGKFKRSSTKAEDEKREKEEAEYTPTKGEKAAEAAANTTKGDTTESKDLYSAPSNDISGGAVAAPVATAVRSGSGSVSPASLPVTPIASKYVSPDDGGVSAELRGRVHDESRLSNDDFEEAQDKFDDNDKALKPPETSVLAKSSKDESPARTSSKFQEEL